MEHFHGPTTSCSCRPIPHFRNQRGLPTQAQSNFRTTYLPPSSQTNTPHSFGRKASNYAPLLITHRTPHQSRSPFQHSPHLYPRAIRRKAHSPAQPNKQIKPETGGSRCIHVSTPTPTPSSILVQSQRWKLRKIPPLRRRESSSPSQPQPAGASSLPP